MGWGNGKLKSNPPTFLLDVIGELVISKSIPAVLFDGLCAPDFLDDGFFVSGSFGDLPDTVRFFNDFECEGITGSFADLPRSLIGLILSSNYPSGDITDLPSTMKFLALNSGTPEFDLQDLPAGLLSFRCFDYSALTGDIDNLPKGIKDVVELTNNSLITGDLADLATGITYLDLNNLSGVSGVYAADASLEYLDFSGTGMSATDTDAFLNAFASVASETSGSAHTAGNFTAASAAARTTLNSKGWYVD